MTSDPTAHDLPCPCGWPARYGACCGRWHAGLLHLQAPDAERLMRSRYSAYVLQNAPYLLATWHPSTRPLQLAFEPGLRWLGLAVLQHTPTDHDHATVAFVARSKLAGRAHRLVEHARFVRENGQWFYLDGDLDDPALGRSQRRAGSASADGSPPPRRPGQA